MEMGIEGYEYLDAVQNDSHSYLCPALIRNLDALKLKSPAAGNASLFELGSGNGSTANLMSQTGWEVVGVDPSSQGMEMASLNYPDISLSQGSAYDDLALKFGQFPVVVSLEVVEHVYYPRKYAQTIFELLKPGGTAIISTPYHGYLKNVALAVSGKMDNHFTALWDNGHIKFWSKKTLSILLKEAGFEDIRFELVGRIPPLAKSMIAYAVKP